MESVFVFVVCGSKEHIDTLHFSLNFIKKYSKKRIIVLTDLERNEIPIIHNEIINIKTPFEFNHHQASIYLKTGIFKFLPEGNLYCYLDTDVISMNSDIDTIFNEFSSPISFAPDHCTMEYFSPFAINCECSNQFKLERERFDIELNKIDFTKKSDDFEIIEARKKLHYVYNEIKQNKIKLLYTAIKYFCSKKNFILNDEILFDKKERKWKLNNGKIFMNDINIRKVAKKSKLKWSYLKNEPISSTGKSIWRDQCNHLLEEIKNKFTIKINKPNFQHWNGGVFLFDDSSRDFLNEWHNSTLEIFKNPKWKTRDQGTLIKTVWQFGLQNHPMLDKKWNLIADFHNPYLKWENDFIRVSLNESYKPSFVHVFHHFGDENWEFWNSLIEKISD
jgi:hypothetical protein